MKKVLLTALALSLPLVLGTTLAEPVLSAQRIIVNPVPTDIAVNVWTDRSSGAQSVPNYQVGDSIQIYASVSRDAYLYLFNVDPDGSVTLVLPNNYSTSNYLYAGEVRAFPSDQDAFTFDIAAPYGLNKVLALASEAPLALDELADFQSQHAQSTGFADVNVFGQEPLAQALSIVVNPVPQNTWSSSVAFYNVAYGYGTDSLSWY